MLGVTEEVVEMKVVKMGKKKGNVWWTEEVKEAVREQRDTYKKTLERNVPEQTRNVKGGGNKCSKRVKGERVKNLDDD